MKMLRHSLGQKLGIDIDYDTEFLVLDPVKHTIYAYESRASMKEVLEETIHDMRDTDEYDMQPVAIADFQTNKIYGVSVLEQEGFLDGIVPLTNVKLLH